MAASENDAALDEGIAKFEKYFEAGDMKSLSEIYTEDCKILPPGMEPQCGRKAVAEVLGAMKPPGVAKIRLVSEDRAMFGDLAYDCGEYIVYKDDGSVVERGNTLMVWKKIDGVYYAHRDCYNAKGKDAKS